MFSNRGAAPGELTPIVRDLVEDAVAGKDPSAIAYTKSGAAFRRDPIGPTSAGEGARKDTRIEKLEAEKRRLAGETAPKDEREDLEVRTQAL